MPVRRRVPSGGRGRVLRSTRLMIDRTEGFRVAIDRLRAVVLEKNASTVLTRSRPWRYWTQHRSRLGIARSRQTFGGSRRVEPPVVESVKAWCGGRSDVECLTFRPAEVTYRQPPRTLEPSVDERFFKIAGSEYTIPEKYLARIPGARLIGEMGLVVLPDGSFASEVTFRKEHLVRQRPYFTPLPPKARRKNGNYFSLLSLWAHQPNYYHWIHDAVLRLHLILPHLPDDTHFIVPPNLRPFQTETLALLGIGPDRLCAYQGRDLWELEALYFAPPTTSSGGNSPAALKWYRELAWSAFDLTPRPGKRRIYISRRRTRYRRIVNEAEIERVLHDHGFETYFTEDLSFREQVELMSEAEIIASPSGAALTNILFAPPGTKILVMVEPVQISVFFWTMAEAAGHAYWYTLGETVPVPVWHDADLIVPPDKVVRTLRAMLAT